MIGAVGGAIYVELGLSDFEPGLCHRDSDIENSRPEIRPQNSRSRAAFMKFSDAETSGSRANPRKSRPFCYDLEMTQRDDSGWLTNQCCSNRSRGSNPSYQGKIQGISPESRQQLEIPAGFDGQIQTVGGKFPTQANRGFIGRYRDRFLTNRVPTVSVHFSHTCFAA